MKKFGKFLLENIAGIAAAVAFAVVVWAFTKFNIYVLIGGFVAAYFIIGWIVEFLIMTFAKAVVKKAPEEETVKPDLRSGLKYAAARRVDIVTDFEGLEGEDENAEAEEAKTEEISEKNAKTGDKKEPSDDVSKENSGENSHDPDEAGENGESDDEASKSDPAPAPAPAPARERDDEGEPYEIPDDDLPEDFDIEETGEDGTEETPEDDTAEPDEELSEEAEPDEDLSEEAEAGEPVEELSEEAEGGEETEKEPAGDEPSDAGKNTNEE